jgi:hypothetical protein
MAPLCEITAYRRKAKVSWGPTHPKLFGCGPIKVQRRAMDGKPFVCSFNFSAAFASLGGDAMIKDFIAGLKIGTTFDPTLVSNSSVTRSAIPFTYPLRPETSPTAPIQNPL